MLHACSLLNTLELTYRLWKRCGLQILGVRTTRTRMGSLPDSSAMREESGTETIVRDPFNARHDVNETDWINGGVRNMRSSGQPDRSSERRRTREGHRNMKWAGSSGSEWQSLQEGSPGDEEVRLVLNLEASSSNPSHPTSILILKLHLLVALRSLMVIDQCLAGLP